MSDAVEPLALGPIRERAEQVDAIRDVFEEGVDVPLPGPIGAHEDRRALLAEVERLRAAPTMKQMAEVLAAHEHCGPETREGASVAEHQAEQIAALWGAR